MSRLTAESALIEQIDAPIASFLSSCVHCGLCADACLFYTETGDPKYTPIRKVEPLRRVWQRHFTLTGKVAGWLGLLPPVSDGELEAWQELVYDSCTLCGRCSAVCPVGNDIAYMIRKTREGMCASGHAPADLISAARTAIDTGSPMGIKLQTLQAQIRNVHAETGIEIPVDLQGADYLLLLSSMEVVNYPEFLAAVARIFQQAGISWTLSTQCFEATNVGIQIGASDIARELVSRAVDAAEKLEVKYLISPECGHAYTAIRWEGPNLIGRAYRFEVVHILELLQQLLQSGRISFGSRDERSVTFHDPCQIVRRGGVVQPPRDLMNAVCSHFTEMPDAGVLNWCCGGGGGVSRIERAEPLRLRAFNRKKQQLETTGAKTLVTACANCRIVLEEGLEATHMDDYKVIGLTELVADHLDDKRSQGADAS